MQVLLCVGTISPQRVKKKKTGMQVCVCVCKLSVSSVCVCVCVGCKKKIERLRIISKKFTKIKTSRFRAGKQNCVTTGSNAPFFHPQAQKKKKIAIFLFLFFLVVPYTETVNNFGVTHTHTRTHKERTKPRMSFNPFTTEPFSK